MIFISGIRLKKTGYSNALLMVICMVFPLLLSSQAVADNRCDELQIRIERLEKELMELKTLLGLRQKDHKEEEIKTESLKEARTAEMDAGKKETGQGTVKDFNIKPYGYIKLDASYDDSRTNNGNYILYVPSESGNRNDNEFNMTARQTRFGIKVSAQRLNNWTAEGKIEIDFYGDGSTTHENKAELMLRHAFIELNKGSFGLIAGQTSDLISPLNPFTLNYTVGWAAGNIGYRRPQLRFIYDAPLSNKDSLVMALAASRTSGLVNEDLDGGGQNDGDDSGFPTIQARLAMATKSCTNRERVFGISGHYGEEEVDWVTGDENMESWSLNWDFEIPLSAQLSVKGEAFVGSNLDDYFGGILKGVNITTHNGIRAKGGWTQINYVWNGQWQYNGGVGFDDPYDRDIEDGDRSQNLFIYINALYKLIPPLTIGLEYSYWDTKYKNADSGRDNRLQTSFIYTW